MLFVIFFPNAFKKACPNAGPPEQSVRVLAPHTHTNWLSIVSIHLKQAGYSIRKCFRNQFSFSLKA